MVSLEEMLPCSQLIFPSKTLSFGNFGEFSAAKNHFKNQYLQHSSIQLLQNKFHQILLIKIFPRTPKAHSNSSQIFS
jgi:hypothetical protein